MEADATESEGPFRTLPESENDRGTPYQRSTVAFPYSPLRDAEMIAQELHDKWGGGATLDQLAGGMGTDARGGTFRVKVGTARTFKVIGPVRGRSINLTPLGRRLLDPQTRANARVEAFLGVPLFARLVEAYRGSVLPPSSGLEKKIADLGVSEKQTVRARQTFLRSAEQAGFFRHGKDRLVEPPKSAESDRRPPIDNESVAEGASTGAVREASVEDLPAPLPELWMTLLRDGSPWSAEKTQEFVQAARKLYELLAKKG
jgi:hypothetical protein